MVLFYLMHLVCSVFNGLRVNSLNSTSVHMTVQLPKLPELLFGIWPINDFNTQNLPLLRLLVYKSGNKIGGREEM